MSFTSEDELVQTLAATYKTEAPIEITGADKAPLSREALDRIQHKLFSALKNLTDLKD